MSDYPFDAEPGESEEEYYQRQRKASEASVGLMMSLARLVFMTLKFGVIYCFFLHMAFLLVNKFGIKK